jgi:hypothetical protein
MEDIKLYEAREKGKILKESLKIVDALAKSDLADMDGDFKSTDFDYEKLQDLIIRARSLTKENWWKLT